MLLKHIENVEERSDQLLQRVRDGVRRRDAVLQEVRHVIHAEGEMHASLQSIAHVQSRLMPQYVRRSATLARTVGENASLAERSSKRVRRLDALLQRVQTTSAIVDAMTAMEGDVAQVPRALEAGDVAKTVALLHSYEEAQRVLASASASASADPNAAASATLVSDAMREARATVQARLLTMIDAAVQVNDKLTIMKLTRLLAELGEAAVASRLYSDWIAEHTIAALAKLIDAEMRKMDDPATVAMTHLALVSQCLDNVAAAFEGDEEFVRDAFGPQGPLALLAGLHSRATARCVPVLSDFVERRRGVLAQLETHASAATAAAAVAARAGPTSSATASRAASPPPATRAAGTAPPPPLSSTSVNALVASARRADKTLEEISHVVSCGCVYLDFVERQQTQYEKLVASAAPAAEEDASGRRAEPSAPTTSDSMWRTRDNALLNAMQDLLAFYVPLQRAYFTSAYDQAVDLQRRAISEAAKEAAAAATTTATNTRAAVSAIGSGASPAAAAAAAAPAAASFMSGLQSLYSVAASSADDLIASVGGGAASATAAAAASAAGGGSGATDLASFWYFTHGGRVTLPDDVFFVLRIAVHRALNTKSAQIGSAVVMSAMDVVQSRLLPEVETHTVVLARGGGFITPDALHWTVAAQQTASYLQRMADELQQLSEATFAATPREVVRFRELASNMRGLGSGLQTRQVPAWLDAFAEACCASLLPPHMERLAAVPYDMKEEVYYHYELNDVWVQACSVDLSAGLQYLHQHLAEPRLFDLLLAAMARRVATATSGVLLRKRFTVFGALQVDKDVRALRSFFVERALNDLAPIRDAFAALNLVAALLLCDTPADALEEAANTALTPEEKKAVLRTRIDFRKEAVMALQL
ncbi:COG4 transport protein [Novymonas esmeraldas]|uniref:Conserved oligomeric Golgi complex subunit 4 n=1 Tax=Novymonas esmeraldas TaxID=1808958 RepID=A0AAW0EQS1_9TRYP